MRAFEECRSKLRASPRTWLVTGAAGFIGSNLVEALLQLNQQVVGLDNLMTGRERNLEELRSLLPEEQWARFRFISGDIRDAQVCEAACAGVDYVLHQAALGSVPRSIDDPLLTHSVNATGFLNMIRAAQRAAVRRFVYASSSSVYGDHPGSPKVEDVLGRPLSPYAVSKLTNEHYAEAFARCYGLPSVGLRYFNVFGRRQDPESAYAAVIPAWIAAMIGRAPVYINGDGETSRDFCYVDNVIQANLLAATGGEATGPHTVCNIAVGGRTTLNELFDLLRAGLTGYFPYIAASRPVYRDFRPGDIRQSLADISRAKALLGYAPTHEIGEGLRAALEWYVRHLGQEGACA
jgi:UDP-N-acetylglucosamine/UDP-N-acetylgalactosamine 4-epimerase